MQNIQFTNKIIFDQLGSSKQLLGLLGDYYYQLQSEIIS